MALRTILTLPDPRLREVSSPVATFDDALNGLIRDLSETLRSTSGIGLSAPQIGELQRVIVLDLSERRAPPKVLINPEILHTSARGWVEESCLSIPGISGNVIRATRLRVRAQNPSGEWVEEDVEGMEAVCVQHELDHLDGRLFIDRLAWPRRLWLRLIRGIETH
jgi:peptide deformylase